MLNILLPIAGRGQRFKDVGYDKPKPLIDVMGKPMVVRAVDNFLGTNIFSRQDMRWTFICLKSLMDEYGQELKDEIGPLDKQFITVDKTTEGAACTALLAKEYINNDDELVISDCDHLTLDPDYFDIALDLFKRRNVDGGIFCFWNDSPKWSYLRISDGLVKEVVEKQVVSNFANTGTYYFRRGRDFVEAAERMISNNVRVNNEFYIAPCYNQLIIDGKKIMPYFVNQMVPLGTPVDLKTYVNSIKY
jgi:dTDP-glucose pyrophosphorylase